MNGYESYHPAVQFLYYALAVGFSMVSMHPVVIAASIIGGLLLFCIRNTPRKIVEEVIFFFFLFLMLSVMNPMFIHSGETILFFMNDNPVTLEALIYGTVSAGMLVGVLLWCMLYHDPDHGQVPVSLWKNYSEDGTDPVHGLPVYPAVQTADPQDQPGTEDHGTLCHGQYSGQDRRRYACL